MLEIAFQANHGVNQMTVRTNKNGVLNAQEATNQKSANKTQKSTSNVTKDLKLIWETYACEEQDGRAVPLDSKETYFSMKPSGSHINQLRKHAHAVAYKLVAINECRPFPEDEF